MENIFSSLRVRPAERGLSIVEVVVAVSIFSVLVLVMGSTVLSIARLQQQALRDARVVDNARYAIETMARTLRTVSSSDITVPSGNTERGGVSSITFTHRGKVGGVGCPDPTQPCTITYGYDAGRHAIVERDTQGGNTSGDLLLTTATVAVSRFAVFLSGRAPSDCRQPRVTILLEVRDPSGSRPSIPLQTTVSLRSVDFENAGVCP
jgi:Tfp pilus assembly protein PilV